MITVDDVVRKAVGATFGRPLVVNVLRSVVVEAIVAEALADWEWCSFDYAPYDFRHPDGTRLEIKQSAARQSWLTNQPSRAEWDISPRTGHWVDGVEWIPKPGRNADIYMFGHHPIFDDTADHRDARQWRFFVVPTEVLPQTKKLSLKSAARLTTPVGFEQLSSRVEEIRNGLVKEKRTGRSRIET